MTMAEIYANPLFGVAVTVAAYAICLLVHQKLRWLNPLFLTATVLISLLIALKIPYESYRRGGELLVFILGPATVALGVPLYKRARQIRQNLWPIMIGVVAGSISGLASAGLLVWVTGGSREIILSMMPKSSTAPIAVEISRQLGGVPELTAVLAVLTGLLGSMFGPRILRLCGVRNDIALGLAMGTSAHGIGTARVIRDSELQGSVSGLAMALAGIATAVLAMPLYWWMK
jgi:predicted murein hydrolase (TIGR00659 family)